MIKKIISGGQTGVDQGALDGAIHCSITHGGWIPAGRKTECGPLPEKYNMQEMKSSFYPDRTRQNIIDSDATLIISRGSLSGGTALTYKIAKELGKPLCHVDLQLLSVRDGAATIKEWLLANNFNILNVAGPRASSDKNIHRDSYELICYVFNTKTVED